MVDRCMYFFIWPLCCLSFDLRILNTTLVFSNSSSYHPYICTTSAKYKYQSRPTVRQDQHIVRIVRMTAIYRDSHYYIQYQPRIIVTVQYHENRETLFLTYIDRGFLYYFLDERFRSRHIWSTGFSIIV